MGPPGGQLGGDLARIWHEGRSGGQSAYRVGPPPWPLTWCGAGDGNRTRIVSLGTVPAGASWGAHLRSRGPRLTSTGLVRTVRVAHLWPNLLPCRWRTRLRRIPFRPGVCPGQWGRGRSLGDGPPSVPPPKQVRPGVSSFPRSGATNERRMRSSRPDVAVRCQPATSRSARTAARAMMYQDRRTSLLQSRASTWRRRT
jgi:hypothetical protein